MDESALPIAVKQVLERGDGKKVGHGSAAGEPDSVQDEWLRLHLFATLCKGDRRETGKDERRMCQLNGPAWLRPVRRTIILANFRQSEVAFFAELTRSAR